MQDHINDSTRLPIITKVFEESFMRQPLSGERECASGTLCECNFIDTANPFICVEFLVPGEQPGPTPQLCVICSRKVTQKLFYDILFTGKTYPGVIQRFGNICNTPGEYARDCCLICPANGPLNNLPFPCMSHQRNKYQVCIFYLQNMNFVIQELILRLFLRTCEH